MQTTDRAALRTERKARVEYRKRRAARQDRFEKRHAREEAAQYATRVRF